MCHLKSTTFEHTHCFCVSTVGGVHQVAFIMLIQPQNLQNKIVVLRWPYKSLNRNVFSAVWQKEENWRQAKQLFLSTLVRKHRGLDSASVSAGEKSRSEGLCAVSYPQS